jgi:hypothetical protein
MFSGARCLKHTQMVDGRVRVAGANLLHRPDATACGMHAHTCQHVGPLATRIRRIRYVLIASAGYDGVLILILAMH